MGKRELSGCWPNAPCRVRRGRGRGSGHVTCSGLSLCASARLRVLTPSPAAASAGMPPLYAAEPPLAAAPMASRRSRARSRRLAEASSAGDDVRTGGGAAGLSCDQAKRKRGVQTVCTLHASNTVFERSTILGHASEHSWDRT